MADKDVQKTINIAVIPGDGIGREITPQTQAVMDKAVGDEIKLQYVDYDLGADVTCATVPCSMMSIWNPSGGRMPSCWGLWATRVCVQGFWSAASCSNSGSASTRPST